MTGRKNFLMPDTTRPFAQKLQEAVSHIDGEIEAVELDELDELADELGTVNESGKWTPPAGSHIDPKTGNILNKDGVVVGTTQEPYSKARPGSQG